MPANILQRVYQSLGLIGDQTPRDLAMPPQRNPPSPLPTFIQFIRSRLSLLNQPPKADDIAAAFVQRLELSLERLDSQLSSCTWFTLVAGKQEWLDTGIDMAAGESVIVMGDGRLYLSRPLDVAIGPSFGLWYRIVNRDGAGLINKVPTGGAAISGEQGGS